jgi:hypothetical protein
MLFRLLRQRGALQKVGKQLVRPAITGVVVFLAALILWKMLLGALHMAGLLQSPPGLRTQYLVPLAIGMAALAYRLWRDIGRRAR